MSGVAEGILVDLAEPEQEENTENFLINTAESLELLREEQPSGRRSITLISPLDTEDRILQDVTDTFNKSNNNSVLVTLDDETFDFDLPLTPVTNSDRSGSIDDDADEEVFFGPVGYMERCVATAVSSVHKDNKPPSPLNPRQIAEICKEANAVAARISSAAGTRRNKAMPKEQLFCSKQLNMDKTPCVFSPKAVGKLLKAVTSRTDNTDDKENEMEVDSYSENSKQICDSMASRIGALENTGNLPLLDISGVTEIVSEHQSSEEDENRGSKSDDSGDMTPSRRHNRSGTYTISKISHDKLPADKRKSLPVINNTDSVLRDGCSADSLTGKTSNVEKRKLAIPCKGGRSLSAGKRSLEVPGNEGRSLSAGKRSLDVPCKEGRSSSVGKRSLDIPQKEGEQRNSASKLKQPASKLAKPRTSIPSAAAANKVDKTASPEVESSQDKPKSRLSAPKAGVIGKESSLLPSKLKAPTSSTSTTGVPSKTASLLPQKSGIPGLKGKLAINGNGKPAPMSKLQLMKPGTMQKSSLTANQNKTTSLVKKSGPMKAFVPAAANKEAAPEMSTPAKDEKHIQPKTLSSNFSTPQKSGSTSSIDSPASSVQKRRSFLPTPNKSRTGSSGSIPSPCPGRNNSVFSNSSRGSSIADSPSLNGSINKGRQRQPSGSKSTGKYPYLDNLNDQSPSAMRPKRQLVTNTPNMPRKKVSKWSPVKRNKPIDPEEQAIMCTKKFKQ